MQIEHKCIIVLDKAIKALKAIDKIAELINFSNRGTCDYFIVDQIEKL